MSFNLSDVAPQALGLMNFTWRADPINKEDAFGAMNEAIKINLPKKTFFNGGEFYGPNSINLEYIRDFFAKYPEQRQHVVVSIKGSVDNNTLAPRPTKEGISQSIENILKFIPDLDIFEPARLDPEVPFEETAKALDDAIDGGKIKAFTLSEVSGSTLEKFTQISKYKPVGAEVEFSIFTRDIIENGVAEVAGRLDIPIIAYSPLSRGLLTGEIKSKSDIPAGDIRHYFERFTEENIKKNIAIVEELVSISREKDVTTAQLALAWLHYHSGKTIDGINYPTIIPIPSSSSANRVQENFAKVELTDDEFNKIQSVIEGKEIHGHRYNDHSSKFLSL
jgi:pyridoxine 4-dehydrogenase